MMVKMRIQIRVQINPCKTPQNVAGGLGGRQPPMMIRQVMIQLEVMIQLRNQKTTKKQWGVGGGSSPMMIEKVMIQLGAKNLKSRGGGWGGGSPPHDDRKSQKNI